jgi:hypothetical protein
MVRALFEVDVITAEVILKSDPVIMGSEAERGREKTRNARSCMFRMHVGYVTAELTCAVLLL